MGTMPDGGEHQGSRKVNPVSESEVENVLEMARRRSGVEVRTERRKSGITDVNIPVFVHDNVDYHIDQLRERKRQLLVELQEVNAELVKHETLRDVTGA